MSLSNQVLNTTDVKFLKATHDALWIPAYRQLAYRQSQRQQYFLCMKPRACRAWAYAYFSKLMSRLEVIAAYRQLNCRYAEVTRHRQLVLTFLGAPNFLKCAPNLGSYCHNSVQHLLALCSASNLH